jgi:ferrochelatase
MAYGSPSRPEDVPAYFADIRGGRPASAEAVEELAERYRRIGGGSPLNEITERQRAALERELSVPVYVGMKHWTPRISEAAERALTDGAERVVGLVLAPHFSHMSVGGYKRQLQEALAGRAELVFITSYHSFEPFIELLAERVSGALTSRSWGAAGKGGKPEARGQYRPSTAERRGRSLLPPAEAGGGGPGLHPAEATAVQAREDAHVVFTAHSLPERILADGDPYMKQLLETSGLVAERAGIKSWSFAFQSESPTGEPWLGPDIVDELERLHGEGVRKVLVAPIGFVADHLEIYWDIDVEAREKAAELGLELDRTESLNDDPAFIRVLASVVTQQPAFPPAGTTP